MNIESIIAAAVKDAVTNLYSIDVATEQVQIQKTKKEFDGDLTVVTFPFTKAAHKAPQMIGEELGNYLTTHYKEIEAFNVIKGFLNLSIRPSFWVDLLGDIYSDEHYELNQATKDSPLMMVEYSSPNTNKPLHLGHIRNNLLGSSIANIQQANHWNVVKTNIVNDRGIHICKSMLAWLKFGNGDTPLSTGEKGDHLVGQYYVAFDKAYKVEIKTLMDQGLSEDEAKDQAPLIQEAREMLRKWEAGDKDVRDLWQKMNQWVYDGFAETYKLMGVDFDKIYYESETYLVGKEKIEEGLKIGLFTKREDGSVWANLEENGLDEKLLLRQDGTSVYMTQDIGTAKLRFDDYPIDKMVYVVGNEQNYHFQVLSILLDRLGFTWGKDLVHFSYGMVELPEGKMKSREGTVVDADDLMQEMIETAKKTALEAGKLGDLNDDEINDIARIVGLGALKYFILKVDPKKNMTFNPKESIDFNGNTGPFIQYTYARIQSLLRRAEKEGIKLQKPKAELKVSAKAQQLIQTLAQFPFVVKDAGDHFSPAVIANYTYDLVKEFNQFYHDYSVMNETDADLKNFRLVLSYSVAKLIKSCLALLGIEVPERM